MIDGICRNPTLLAMEGGTCDHNMANVPTSRFFEGTVDAPNNLPTASYNKMINSPKSKEYGEEIATFQSWSQGFGQQLDCFGFLAPLKSIPVVCGHLMALLINAL